MRDPVALLEEFSFDLADPRDQARIVVSGAEVRFDEGGAHLLPVAADASLELDLGPVRFDRLEVEMEAPPHGSVELYWSCDRRLFTEARKLSLRIEPSGRMERYEFDLAATAGEDGEGCRFRLDPVNRHAPVSIRSLRLARSPTSEAPRRSGPRAGRMELGKELRDVVGLGCGERFEFDLDDANAVSVGFGYGRPWFSRHPIRLSLESVEWPSDRVVWQEVAGTDRLSEFVDRRVDLPARRWSSSPARLRWTATCDPSLGAEERRRERVLISGPFSSAPRPPARPNLVWISMDTVGAGAFEELLEAGRLRHLGGLAASGVRLDGAHAASSLTHLSHASMLTGLRPQTTGFVHDSAHLGETPTIASLLSEAGYRTAAFTGGVQLRPGAGFDRGFDLFYREDTLFKPFGETSDLESLVTRAGRWLGAAQSAPFFLFFHTYEAHGPYFPLATDLEISRRLGTSGTPIGFLFTHMRGRLPVERSELGTLIQIGDHGSVEGRPLGDTAAGSTAFAAARRAHLDEIEKIDAAVGSLIETVALLGELERTLFVVSADHGESFFEHGFLEHGNLYEENLRVPVILSGTARVPRGRTLAGRASLVDLVPTVLRLLGVPVETTFDGRSLAPFLNGDSRLETLSETAFVPGEGLALFHGSHKLMMRSALYAEDFGHHELIDLATDPAERAPSTGSGVPLPDALAHDLEQAVDGFPGTHVDLSELHGETIEIEITPGDFRDELLGFDLTPRGPTALANGVARRRVRVGARGELVLAAGHLGTGIVALDCILESGARIGIPLGDRRPRRNRSSIPTVRRGAPAFLHAWLVTPARGSGTVAPIQGEEASRLRSLGYLR